MENKILKNVIQSIKVGFTLAFVLLFTITGFINGSYAAKEKNKSWKHKKHHHITDLLKKDCPLPKEESVTKSDELKYAIKDLGAVYNESHGRAINDSGSVSGWAYNYPVPCPDSMGGSSKMCTFPQPFIYEKDVMKIVAPDKMSFGQSLTMSLAGLAGSLKDASMPSSPFYAFFSDKNGNITRLPNLAGYDSGADGMNDAGQIVGYSSSADGMPQAVLWEKGLIKEVGTFPGDMGSFAADINNNGYVAGYSFSEDGFVHAFIARPPEKKSKDTAFRLFKLPDLDPDFGISYASAINDKNVIVGLSSDADGVLQAVRWNANRELERLKTPGLESQAVDINNRGYILLNSDNNSYLYVNDVAIDLYSLLPPNSGWTKLSASGINNDGWITGSGIKDGKYKAFLMIPQK